MIERATWVSLGFILSAMLVCYGIIVLDRNLRAKGDVTGPVEHWMVMVHGSGQREHTLDLICAFTAKGCEAPPRASSSFQRFCVDGPDPFYEGMTVDLYFQRYEKCWQIVNYTIRRDAYGYPAEANQAAR